uniref:SH2 domain-containing protein n=1 Tax=Parascaris univalens TaxID=6257 RepID=A0A915A172_PARUN
MTSCALRGFAVGFCPFWIAIKLQRVREAEILPGDRHRYLRLPMRWSLGRWITNRSFQPNIGLIPTCWLTTRTFYEENKRLFKRPTWYIGIADVTTAYDYLLEDRSSLRPGLFVVFSPIWLNIDPRDHRPFILLLVCCKTPKILDEMVNSINIESKTTTALEDLGNRIRVISNRKKEDALNKRAASRIDAHDLKALASKSECGTSVVKKGSAGGSEESDKGAKQRETLIQGRAVEHAALPFYVKQQVAFFASVPPPFRSPQRDVFALTMNSEQWAALH